MSHTTSAKVSREGDTMRTKMFLFAVTV